jgi:ubiquitin carboxyl-terminal hydrolase 34
MHHEATACHVTGEIVELLTLLIEILRTFKPKDNAHPIQVFAAGEIQIHRLIATSKEWPEVLRKLATFLNTYNNGDLRSTAIGECMNEMIEMMILHHRYILSDRMGNIVTLP